MQNIILNITSSCHETLQNTSLTLFRELSIDENEKKTIEVLSSLNLRLASASASGIGLYIIRVYLCVFLFFFFPLYVELSDNSTICIHVVRSKRCNERPIMTSWDCQIKFLPLVVPTSSRRLQSDNVLECMDKKDTFLMNCPTLREEGTELSDECNQLKTNNKDCNLGNFKCTSQKLINQVRTIAAS